jgi:type IV secretion system protein VirB10
MSQPDYGGLERDGAVGATVARPGGNALTRVVAVVAAVIATAAVLWFGIFAPTPRNEPVPVVQQEEFVPPPQPNMQSGFQTPRSPEIPRFEVPIAPPAPPPLPPPQPSVVVPEPAPPPPAAAPTVVEVPGPPLREPDCANPNDRQHPKCIALEEERKRLARLNSPVTVVDAGSAGLAGAQADPNAASAAARQAGGGGQESDPFRAFLNQRGSAGVEISAAVQNRRPDATIMQGEFIRGVLETAINSDLPGQVRAVVTQDVFSFDGRRVLIPSGSRLVGDYRSGVTRGQERVFIVWTRLIRPDGASVQLGSFGADALGRSGMTGVADQKYLERFGSAVLLTVIGGASQFIAQLGNPNANLQNQGIPIIDPVTGAITIVPGGSTINGRLAIAQQVGAQTVSQTLTQLASEAFRDAQQIQPTIHVRQGERIIVFVGRDLDFSEIYPDPVKEEFERLRAQHLRRGEAVRK